MSQTVKGRILKGIGASSLGQVVNLVIQLVSLPAFLALLGKERFGDWLILSSWASLLAMSDIGFASAAGNDMTMRVGRGDRAGAIEVFQSVWVLLSLGSLAVFAVVLTGVWGLGVGDWLPVERVTSLESAQVLTLLAGVVLVSLQLGLLDAGFRCDGNFATGVSLSAGLRLVEFIAQLGVAYVTGSIVLMAAAALLVRCLSFVIFWLILKQRCAWLKLGLSHARGETIRKLAAPAVSFMGMPLGHAIVNQGMLNVVAAALGSNAVVIFDAHRRLTNAGTQLMSMINHSVWPELSRAQGGGDMNLSRRLHRAACSVTLWISVSCAVAIGALGWWIIPTWTSGDITQNFPLLALLLVGLVLRSLWYTSSVVLMSSNRHQQLAALFLASGVAALGVAWWLLPSWGLAGAATGALVAEFAMFTYVLRTVLEATSDDLPQFIPAVLRPDFIKSLRPVVT